MKKTLKLSLIGSLLLTNLHAQTIELGEVSIEAANRTSQNVKDLTESTTVITAEDIKESRVQTLTEALNRLGNITMVSNGGLGQNSSFLLRGMDSQRVLVLIDGIRYNDITGGAQYSHLQLNNVERIEIIKGAQSGIWGSDASAGVINIVTKSAKKGTHMTANIEGGSFNTQLGSVQLSHKTDDFDILASVSRVKTDGFSAAEPTKGSPDYGRREDELGYEKDGYTNNTYDIKLGYNITDEDRIEAYIKRIDAYVEYDAGAGVDAENYDDPFGFGTSAYFDKVDNRYYSANYKHTGDTHKINLQYNYSYLHRKVQAFKGNVQEVSLQDRIDYMKDSFIRVGGSYQNFEHEEAGSAIEASYNAKAAYLTNYNKFLIFENLGNTIFTQSLRFDSYSDFDDKVTGKLGAKQFLHEDIYLSSNYGTGYNAPTLYQLYAPPFFGSTFSNPLLTPETTKTFDITLGNDRLTATYFHNRVKDLIEYDTTSSRFENVFGTSTIKGVELGYKDDYFDVIALNLNYTYLDSKNADGDFLRSRPKHQIDGNVFYYINEDLNIGLNGQYIGERYDRDDRQGAQTGKYAVYNTVINYTINENFTVYGKVDNIGDKYYQVRDGYATSERAYYAGLTASF